MRQGATSFFAVAAKRTFGPRQLTAASLDTEKVTRAHTKYPCVRVSRNISRR